MLKFEFKRLIAKKHHIAIVFLFILMFGINIFFELATSELNTDINIKLSNIIKVFMQFTPFVFLALISNTFSYDYENKIGSFYLHNKVTPVKLYFSKMFVYLITSFIIFFPMIYFYLNYYLKRNFNGYLILLIFMNIMIGILTIMFFSIVFKKRWACVLATLIVWTIAQIINGLSIPIISGNFIPFDGNNNVINTIVSNKNILLEVDYLKQPFLVCTFWIITLVFLTLLLCNKRFIRNAV